MSRADEDKWNRKYREGAYAERTHPSALLREWQPRLSVASQPPRALDIGCGAGRNALFLARLGWSVTALDISQVALDRLAEDAAAQRLPILCTQADLESAAPLPAALAASERYDLVVMVRYTNLPLIEILRRVLADGGYLLVELHLQTDAAVIGPRSPQFRVAPGELRKAADGLEIIEYREGLVTEPDGRVAALAQLIARSS